MQWTHRLLLAFSIVVALAGGCAAQVQIIVDAGGMARHNAPVEARLEAAHLANPSVPVEAVLRSDDGQVVRAQVERRGEWLELRWIEPKLQANERRTYTVSAMPRRSGRFHFIDGDGYRDLQHHDTPILRHVNRYDPQNHDPTHKPFHHVFRFGAVDARDPSNAFITNGPGGKFPHHRGLFFGFNKTPHGDFWHCRGVSQQHRSYVKEQEFAGTVAARGVSVAEWVDAQGKAVVRDTRRVTTWRASGTHLILDFEITLETLTGETFALDGDAHHSGFHFRAANEVADREHGAAFTYPSGAKDLGNDIWGEANWVHAAFDIAGRTYGVTHIDHPSNPRPTTYSTRPYGRFGAFFTHQLKPGEPLTVRYRVIVRDGSVALTEQALADEARGYHEPVKVLMSR